MSYIIAVLVFGLLIFLHELGHFIAAKLSGVTVLQFTIGFGPAIFKKKIGGTVYAIRLLPLGGAVMMQGEEDEEAESLLVGEKNSQEPAAEVSSEGSFYEASLFKRFCISVAGAGMNFLTGLVIIFLLLQPARYHTTAKIAEFMNGFPYAAADDPDGLGFREGDEILRVNDFRVFTLSDFNMGMSYDKDNVYDIVLKRDGQKIELKNFEMKPTVYDEESGSYLYGFRLKTEEIGLGGKISYSFKNAMTYLQSAVLGLKMMLTGQVSSGDMMGTLGIASQMGEAAKQSLATLWNFTAYISINLAFVNLLPIPALDGGKILFLLIELVRGEKLDPKYESTASLIGLVLLLGLFVFVTYHDIVRLIK